MEQKQLRQVVNITPSREICPSPKSTFETWWICKRAKKSCCACLRDRLCDIPRFQKPFPPVATADEIDPEGLMSPVWGTRWTLPRPMRSSFAPRVMNSASSSFLATIWQELMQLYKVPDGIPQSASFLPSVQYRA